MDFQSQQIERIVEAIALTLPQGTSNTNQSFLGGFGIGTISSGNLEYNPTQKFEDYCIRELAFDLGVDPRILKSKLLQMFSGQEKETNLNNIQFHL